MSQPELTSEQYVARYVATKKRHCPFCGGDGDVYFLDEEDTGDGMVAHYDCERCGAEWEEVYKLVAYRDLAGGEMREET